MMPEGDEILFIGKSYHSSALFFGHREQVFQYIFYLKYIVTDMLHLKKM